MKIPNTILNNHENINEIGKSKFLRKINFRKIRFCNFAVIQK